VTTKVTDNKSWCDSESVSSLQTSRRAALPSLALARKMALTEKNAAMGDSRYSFLLRSAIINMLVENVMSF
jgi:hypothetical protein